MTEIYKTIKLDSEQLAITMTALEKFIDEQNEQVNF